MLLFYIEGKKVPQKPSFIKGLWLIHSRFISLSDYDIYSLGKLLEVCTLF